MCLALFTCLICFISTFGSNSFNSADVMQQTNKAKLSLALLQLWCCFQERMKRTDIHKLGKLQQNTANIRNICILAHVDHGEFWRLYLLTCIFKLSNSNVTSVHIVTMLLFCFISLCWILKYFFLFPVS